MTLIAVVGHAELLLRGTGSCLDCHLMISLEIARLVIDGIDYGYVIAPCELTWLMCRCYKKHLYIHPLLSPRLAFPSLASISSCATFKSVVMAASGAMMNITAQSSTHIFGKHTYK